MADIIKRPTKRQTKTVEATAPKRRGRPKKTRGAANSSDTAAARWTVRGIPSNVRELAVKAADLRGMTVGDWLAETIALSARKSISADSGDNLPTIALPELVEQMQTMNERLTQIEKERQKTWLGRLLGGQ
jgi:hypothetical protein